MEIDFNESTILRYTQLIVVYHRAFDIIILVLRNNLFCEITNETVALMLNIFV